MKKFLSFIFFVVISTSLSAQISVFDFAMCEECVVMKPPRDSNGNYCSLLEISTPGINAEQRQKFRFEADAATQIVETTYPEGVIWVWLSPEAFSLLIIHDDYGRKNFEFPILIKPKKTYTMDITYGSGGDEVFEGWIVLESDPDNADVYVNDKLMGMTPFSLKVPYGNYDIRIEKALYEKAYKRVQVNKDKNTANIVLNPKHGFVHVVTHPAGAEVTVDENITFTSPEMSPKIPSGNHRITIRMNRYNIYNQIVTIEDGKTVELDINLEPNFSTTTIINSAGGDIFVDGKLEGQDTVYVELTDGKHDLEARAENHKSDKKSIVSQKGKSEVVTLAPTAISGNIDVVSIPLDATIFIDGKDCGTTPSTIKNIIIGEHSVVLSKKGYVSVTKNVIVNENKTAKVDVKLEKGVDKPVVIQKPENKVEDVVIKEIEFANVDFDGNIITKFGDMLFADDLRYILPRIIIDNNLPDSKTMRLSVKIINPDGTRIKGLNVKKQYTYFCMINIPAKTEGEIIDLLSWGNDIPGYYSPGTYRIEIYYDDNMIAESDIIINTKAKAITINDIDFANVDYNGNIINDFGSSLSAKEMRYLQPRITCDNNSFSKKDLSLNVKIIKPNGNIERAPLSPKSYTYSVDVSLPVNMKDGKIKLLNWGNDERSVFTFGEYRIEIYYENEKIAEKTVTILK